MNVMWTLFKKDWRLLAPVRVVAYSVFALSAVLVWVATAFMASSPNDPPKWAIRWMFILPMSVLVGVLVSHIVIPAIAPCVTCRERRDNSASFLAMLPVSRVQLVVSKGIVVVCALLWPWMIVAVLVLLWAAVTYFIEPKVVREVIAGILTSSPEPHLFDFLWTVVLILTACIASGWLWGWLLRSEALAIFLSMATPIVAIATTQTTISLLNTQIVDAAQRAYSSGNGSMWEDPRVIEFEPKLQLVLAIVTGVTLLIGTAVALYRKTP
jgi:hypothetical protein